MLQPHRAVSTAVKVSYNGKQHPRPPWLAGTHENTSLIQWIIQSIIFFTYIKAILARVEGKVWDFSRKQYQHIENFTTVHQCCGFDLVFIQQIGLYFNVQVAGEVEFYTYDFYTNMRKGKHTRLKTDE